MKKIICLFLAVFMLAGCTPSQPTNPDPTPKTVDKYSNMTVSAGFDTYFSLVVYTESQEKFDEYFDESVNMFTKYNQLFDIYNDYDGVNNLKTINDNAGIAPVEVDEAIIEMLDDAKYFYDLSNGEFNITLGSVLKVWHNYREEGINLMNEGKLGHTPSTDELETANKCVGWDYVEIDEENNTVYLNDSCASLDVGGVAKGFAAEKIAEYLENDGVTSGIVDAGGNSRIIGSKPDGSSWVIGIQNPNGNGTIISISSDHASSFVTSGDYQRYYTSEDGNNYHHIIDPKTLFPATNFHSVSIVTSDSAYADCLSTTLFTMSYEDGLTLINDFKQQNPNTELEVIWIMDNDHKVDAPNYKEVDNLYIVYTSGLEGRINWQ